MGIDQKINDPISVCEDLLHNFKEKPSIHYRNSQPRYIPSLDKIHCTLQDEFIIPCPKFGTN